MVSQSASDKAKKLAKEKVSKVNFKGKEYRVENIRFDGQNLRYDLFHPEKEFNNPFIIVNPPIKVQTGTKKVERMTPNGLKEVEVPVLEEKPGQAIQNIVKNSIRRRV